MVTIRQLLKKRKPKRIFFKIKPQFKGTCLSVFIKTPKKPNSARRKVAKVLLSNNRIVTAFIPGETHNLQEHSTVLVIKHKVQDLPGVNYCIVRGVFDCSNVPNRKTSRSKYGTSKSSQV